MSANSQSNEMIRGEDLALIGAVDALAQLAQASLGGALEMLDRYPGEHYATLRESIRASCQQIHLTRMTAHDLCPGLAVTDDTQPLRVVQP